MSLLLFWIFKGSLAIMAVFSAKNWGSSRISDLMNGKKPSFDTRLAMVLAFILAAVSTFGQYPE